MKIFPDGKYKKVRLAICALSLLATVFYVFLFPYLLYLQYKPQEGDIVFQSLPRASDLVKAIEGVSESEYSHCGVVVKINGKWHVKEALGTVHYTELLTWIKRGRGYRINIYRFKTDYIKFTNKFVKALDSYQNLPYDFRYKLNDFEIYCSELPYRAFKDITGQDLGKLSKLVDMNWKPYEQTITKYEGGPAPLERLMITPKNLSEASQLEYVQSLGI